MPHPPALTGDLPHTDYTTLSLSASAETGLNARTHARVRLAEILSAMAGLLTGETVEPRAFDAVYRDMLLYDEHCFGMGIPCGRGQRIRLEFQAALRQAGGGAHGAAAVRRDAKHRKAAGFGAGALCDRF